MRIMVIAVAIGCVVACSTGRPDGIYVAAADSGEIWPFTVPFGTLRCDRDGQAQMVRIETENRLQYGLNGSAKAFGWSDVTPILKPGMVGADLQPFIDLGLTLCR